MANVEEENVRDATESVVQTQLWAMLVGLIKLASNKFKMEWAIMFALLRW